MDTVDTVRGMEMSERERAEFLREQGVGLLSLAAGNDAYAVPISFGYTDAPQRLYFDLIQFGDESRKIQFVERTDVAAFTTFTVQSRFDWRSVVVTGSIDEVPEDEYDQMDDVMDDNAWFPSLFPPDQPMTGVTRSVLTIDEATGRKGEAEQ